MTSREATSATPISLAPPAIPAWVLRLRLPVGLLSMALLLRFSLSISARAASGRGLLVPASHNAYPDWMRGALEGVTHTLPTQQDFKHYVLYMLVLYGLVIVCSYGMSPQLVAAGSGALLCVMFLAPPILSADVFGYIDFARLGAVHHLNPYVHRIGSVPSDPVHPYVRWHHLTTPYGPLFTTLSYAVTSLKVSTALWVFKTVAFVSALSLVGLVWACARTIGRPPAPAIALVGLNPLLAVWGVGGAHNDLLMMAVALTGVLLLLRGRPIAGGVGLMGAVGLKASAAALLPYAVLGSPGRRTKLVTSILVTLGGIVIVALAAFGTKGLGFLSVLGGQQKLIAIASVPKQVSILFGFHDLPGGIRAVAVAMFAIVVLVTLVHTARGGDWITNAGWATFALLLASAWLLPWYIVWLLPLAALSRTRWLVFATCALTAYIAMVKVIPLQ